MAKHPSHELMRFLSHDANFRAQKRYLDALALSKCRYRDVRKNEWLREEMIMTTTMFGFEFDSKKR
jgi:hypothetical protein